MSNTKEIGFRDTIKWALVYGGVLGIILLALSLADYTIGFQGEDKTLSNLNYLLRIIGIFFSIAHYKKKVLKAHISFSQGFVFGIFTFIFAMFIIDFAVCIVFNLYPEFLTKKLAVIRQHLLNAGISEAQIETYIATTLWIKNPFYILISFLVWVVLFGPFISLISALMLADKPEPNKIKKRRKIIPEKKEEGPTVSSILLGKNDLESNL